MVISSRFASARMSFKSFLISSSLGAPSATVPFFAGGFFKGSSSSSETLSSASSSSSLLASLRFFLAGGATRFFCGVDLGVTVLRDFFGFFKENGVKHYVSHWRADRLTSLSSESACSSDSSSSDGSSSLSESWLRFFPRPRATAPRFGAARLAGAFRFLAGTTSSSLKSSSDSSSDSSDSVSLPRFPRPPPAPRVGLPVGAFLEDFRRSPSESEPPPDGLYCKKRDLDWFLSERFYRTHVWSFVRVFASLFTANSWARFFDLLLFFTASEV